MPPPGAGFVTLMPKDSAIWMRELGTLTVIAPGLTDVSGSTVPPKLTILACVKPLPLTVRVTGPEFTTIDGGEKYEMDGTGLATMKLDDALPPPAPGFVTVTATVPEF